LIGNSGGFSDVIDVFMCWEHHTTTSWNHTPVEILQADVHKSFWDSGEHILFKKIINN
jgi:hypothetical protein